MELKDLYYEAEALGIRGFSSMSKSDLELAIIYARKTYPRTQTWNVHCYTCGTGFGGHTDRKESLQFFDDHEIQGHIVTLSARTMRVRPK